MKCMLKALAATLVLLLPSAVFAEGDEPSPNAKARQSLGKDPEVKAAEDDAAKKLLTEIEAADDAKDDAALAAALEAMVTLRHEDFVKPLEKYARHKSENVRTMAIQAYGSQEPANKLGPKLMGFMKWKPNEDSPRILAMCVSSLRRLKYDNPAVMKEIEGHFRKQKYEDVMRECARYFGDLGKKETFDMLLGWVEQPQPANVNSGTNPPASYWQRMFEIWDRIKEAVWVALEDLTGKAFRTEREWRAWLDTPEAREKGFK